MMIHSGKKRKFSLAAVLTLAFALLVNSAAFGAITYKYGYFPDVDENHWAGQVITKMSLTDVAKGYEESDGTYTFRPDREVTQMEAVIMALRLAGAEDDSVDIGRYIPVAVPDWAKGSAITAYDKGWISEDDFSSSAPAQRQWIAKLLVLMLDREDEVSGVSELILPFTDNLDISLSYYNYVKVAYDNGLVKGTSDNRFEPARTVSRAEMAAFLSRAGDKLEATNGKSSFGTVVSVSGEVMEILDDTGMQKSYAWNVSTNICPGDGSGLMSSFVAGDRVEFIAGSGSLQYIQHTSRTAGSNAVMTVLKVYAEENTLVVRNPAGGMKTVELAAGTEFLYDADNSSIAIGDIEENSSVRFVYSSDGEITKVISVSGKVAAAASGGSILYDLDSALGIITLRESDSLQAYLLADSYEVKLTSGSPGTEADLEKGDLVSVTTEDGRVTVVTIISKDAELYLEGRVIVIRTDDRLLTVEDSESGKLESYYVASGVTVDFSGEKAALENLQENDSIRAEIEQGKIISLEVTDRKLYDSHKGFVVAVDTVNRVITIYDSEGTLHAYEVDNDAEVEVNGSDSYLSYVKKDMTVELEIRDNEAVSISAKNTMEGTVVRIDAENDIFEISLDSGETRSYSISGDLDVDLETVSGADAEDVANGDRVEIRVSDGEVTEIKVSSSVVYEVLVNHEASSRLEVRDEDGDKRNLYVYDSMDITVGGEGDVAKERIAEGDVITAEFMGYDLLSVDIHPVLSGTVVSASAVTGTVNVNLNAGGSASYSFGTGSRVEKAGTVYSNIGPLAAGQRVMIRENLSGGRTYYILESVSGRLGTIYADRTRVYLKETATLWKQYNMNTGAYLHSGNTELSPSDFAQDDQVTIYLYEDEVYEVEK